MSPRLTEQIEHTDALIEDRFARHELAEVISSMPGIGVLLGAEFLAATGGDMTAFASADHLAGSATVGTVEALGIYDPRRGRRRGAVRRMASRREAFPDR